jgi:hypothetical protein
MSVRALWWVFFLSYAALIFWLSDSPLPPGVPFIELPGADRAYHFFEYGLLSLLGLQAFSPRTRRRFWGVLALCWLYGPDRRSSSIVGARAQRRYWRLARRWARDLDDGVAVGRWRRL